MHQCQIDLVDVAAAIMLHHFQIYGALERRRGQPGSTFLLQTGQEAAAIRKVMQECGPSLVYLGAGRILVKTQNFYFKLLPT